MSPPKGASSSPNTPLSDRLLSHSPATSAASALEQPTPDVSTPPLKVQISCLTVHATPAELVLCMRHHKCRLWRGHLGAWSTCCSADC